MKIAIASGKGGTGKTMVSTNLAKVFASKEQLVSYCDCDVEAPNGHIFLKPEIEYRISVNNPVPEINQDLCDGCRQCSQICQFSAIVVLRGNVLTYPELCHGCGGCMLVCPRKAITEKNIPVGGVEVGTSDKLIFISGNLNIGEARAVPVISRAKKELVDNGLSIIDAPPGTSCPMIEAVKDCDYVVLVTEPTPFGFNDLKLAISTVKELGIPFGVIINRFDIGKDEVEKYCHDEGIRIHARIPYSRSIAEVYSQGKLLVDHLPQQWEFYHEIADSISEAVLKKVIS